MATQTVRVSGLRELTRAFKKMEGDLKKELRRELVKAALPVKELAEQLDMTRIRNMPSSPRWSNMRIGVTQNSVYIVPVAKRAGGTGRPNLKGLLLDRAMDPAVMQKQDEIVEGVGKMIDTLAGKSGF